MKTRVFLRKDQWSRIICNTENFVLIVVPGLTSSSSASSSSSQTLMKQESHSSSSSLSSPSSTTVGEMSVREREDAPNSDISPVPVSELVDARTEKPVETQANQGETCVMILRFRNGCKNSGKIWWMMKFHYREALTPILLMKLLFEPTTKRREDLGRHSVYTHFPKDRNCEICKRTKITRAPCRRRTGEAVPRAVNFGDLITADRNNHRYAVVVQDLATQWIQAYPCKKQDFTRNPEKLAEVLGTREETKSHLH